MAKFYYGGQAVIEGVMMRGRTLVAMAIRRPDQRIYVYQEASTLRGYQNRVFRLPFLRGVLLLWETLILGSRLMTLSANIAGGVIDPDELSSDEGASQKVSNAALIVPMLVSLSLAVAFFFVGPVVVTSLMPAVISDSWLGFVVEGIIRLGLLLGYLYFIGRVPDIQRVFGYHGAEHKAINTMEQGYSLDVEHVRRASRVHTRCGTGFLLLVVAVSIVVFALVGLPSILVKIVARIILVPVVAGIAYELMRLGAENYRYRVVRWLLAPVLALQRMTTREPDDGMIECAIAALQRVMECDAQEFTSSTRPDQPPLAV
ncbi:MAG TPA: DUF1385 domain-containing protein [Ktedonobacteraceae bacterium]|jgi:uncharacterized protein YqhQ